MLKRKADKTISEPQSKTLKTCHKRRDYLMIYVVDIPGLIDIIEIYLDLVLDEKLCEFNIGLYHLIFTELGVDDEDCPIWQWSEKSVPAIRAMLETNFLNNEEALSLAQECALECKREKESLDAWDSYITTNNVDAHGLLMNILDPFTLIKNLHFLGAILNVGAILNIEEFEESTLRGEIDEYCQAFFVSVYL